ncbi:MAG TPA: amidohydrolase family protein [Tepidisphaeraceae bacterium]|jgi:L-fuconolactonase|nr:amidohydrolase family protein [Tepidisphaeraceae bacterium]
MKAVIDAHHHFWKYSPAEYGWIDEQKAILRRDFGPEELKAEIAAAGVDGVISVQARQTTAETDSLLNLAEKNEFIRGVVGWGPLLDSARLREHLERWLHSTGSPRVDSTGSPRANSTSSPPAGRTKLVGLRHVLQDEPDDQFILRPDFDAGLASLKEYDLRYDLLIFERQLSAAIEAVDRHPQQVFILDHIAKPRIAGGEFSMWEKQIRDLAKRSHVYCKISGVATEANWKTWTAAQLQPYFDVVLEAFGPGRLMFGSDWPVCLLASGYGHWAQTVRNWTSRLSTEEQSQIWGRTALKAYGVAPA